MLYDGKKWKQNSGNFWDYTINKLDLTYAQETPMENLVNQLLDQANADMDSKPAKRIKEKKAHGRSSQKRYPNYWRGQRYAR